MSDRRWFKVFQRILRRIETKLIRFAEELGIDLDVNPDWLLIDWESSEITLTTLGRSLHVINQRAKKFGAKRGDTYRLRFKEQIIGTLVIQ